MLVVLAETRSGEKEEASLGLVNMFCAVLIVDEGEACGGCCELVPDMNANACFAANCFEFCNKCELYEGFFFLFYSCNGLFVCFLNNLNERKGVFFLPSSI